jgi:hypothetical protein
MISESRPALTLGFGNIRPCATFPARVYDSVEARQITLFNSTWSKLERPEPKLGTRKQRRQEAKCQVHT